MADVRTQPHQLQVHPQRQHEGGVKTLLPQRGPSATQVLAVVTGIPVGGTLMILAGLTLAGSVIGLMVAFPLFVIFSPIIVPAAIAVGLAVMGFLASGAIGLTGLSSMSWVLNYLSRAKEAVPEQIDYAKRRMAGVAGYVGSKTKDVGQSIETKAHEVQIST
ncbi:PREDICTED: oleosin 5 [Tarenaya hassleriana]|uniref:oleosin 5 n=1 Tax=Tarenaya hassleriana TaxID=28532 RepID=UPI00053C64D2|nr:PREDICTED: oleosin 5 [Tarenaya hassleriana]